MLFNEKLKMLRKESNLTQEELAEKLNVSRQAITKWEIGEGMPDIENLKQISLLFNTTIDELVKEEKDIVIKELLKYRYEEELDVDHIKHFDVNISCAYELNLISNLEEKVKVEILSNKVENLNEVFKIKFDDIYNRLDLNIKSTEDIDDVRINLYIPVKYIKEIELKSKIRVLSVIGLELECLEYDGVLKYLNVKETKGRIVLNTSKCDVEATYDILEGTLEVNTINSVARVELPKDTKYKTLLKGIKNEFVNAINTETSENMIELNGANSKLIIIDRI